MAFLWTGILKVFTTTETYKKFGLALLIVSANASHTKDEISKLETKDLAYRVEHAKFGDQMMNYYSQEFAAIRAAISKPNGEIHEIHDDIKAMRKILDQTTKNKE